MQGRRKEIVSGGGGGGGGMTKESFRAAKYSKVAKAVFQKSEGAHAPGFLRHCNDDRGTRNAG